MNNQNFAHPRSHNRVNYDRVMQDTLRQLAREGLRPTLLLHACCAPCSSATLERLAEAFRVTILYYNPNIAPPAEYHRREAELERFVRDAGYADRGIRVVELPYQPAEFYEAVRGLEAEPERGERCTACYRLRLECAARYAAAHRFDWFTTTLSISPMKDPVRLNEIGCRLAEQYGLRYLQSEFRKRDGYKRSLALSAEYGLYRQEYCGCIFSKQQREAQAPRPAGPAAPRKGDERMKESACTRPHVLVALPLNEAHRASLLAAAPGAEFCFVTEGTPTPDQVAWADCILGNIPVELIRTNDHLRWFQSNAAGPDSYLVPGVLPPDCIVTTATGAYGLAISEWMLGLWLGLCKDLFLYRDQQRDHAWRKQPRHVCGVDGARVLCVGMGDIGSAFARKAHALGARVVGVRRTAHPDQPCPPYCLRVVGQDALDAELPEADLVALSLPGTGETAHLMNADRLARMKEGAILINVGRGTAVDTDALAAALHSGHLRGAGLDVTDPEPLPPDHPLWDEPGAVITPHNAGHFSWLRTLDNIVAICGVNLRHLMAGEPLDNQVARGARYVTGAAPGRRLQGTDLSL